MHDKQSLECNLIVDDDFMNKDESELVSGYFYLFNVKDNKTYLYKDGHIGVAYFDTCGELVGKSYYEAIWRPDTLTGLENGKVPVLFIVSYLPDLIRDLIKYGSVLTQYLPENGYGTFEGLIEFLCNYLKECYTYKNEYVYCCR